jgi:general secretion pathway protein A
MCQIAANLAASRLEPAELGSNMALLSMEDQYLDYFGLKDEPFSTSPNPRYLWLSGPHDLALRKIKWAIGGKRGLSLVFGQVGAGKSSIGRELSQRCEDDLRVEHVFLTNPNYPSPIQLLKAIIQQFGITESPRSFIAGLDLLKAFLYRKAVDEGKTLVLIIDEANTMRMPLLELLRQLMNFESNDQKFLQIVLFGQEEFRTKIRHPRFRHLYNRAAMTADLHPFTLEESGAMLRFRWTVAGGQQFPFTEQAVAAIFHYTQGVPRTEVILCDQACLAAQLAGLQTIDADVIEGLVIERALPDVQPTPAPITGLPTRRRSAKTKAVAARRSA